MQVIGFVNTAGSSIPQGTTIYGLFPPGGAAMGTTSRTMLTSSRGTLKHLRIDVSANTLTADATVEILMAYQAGAAVIRIQPLFVTITAGTTGIFSDDTNEVSLGPCGGGLSFRIIAGAGAGSITIDSISLLALDEYCITHRSDLL